MFLLPHTLFSLPPCELQASPLSPLTLSPLSLVFSRSSVINSVIKPRGLFTNKMMVTLTRMRMRMRLMRFQKVQLCLDSDARAPRWSRRIMQRFAVFVSRAGSHHQTLLRRSEGALRTGCVGGSAVERSLVSSRMFCSLTKRCPSK